MSLLKQLEDQMIGIEGEVSTLSRHLVDRPTDEASRKRMKTLIDQHADLIRQYAAAPAEITA